MEMNSSDVESLLGNFFGDQFIRRRLYLPPLLANLSLSLVSSHSEFRVVTATNGRTDEARHLYLQVHPLNKPDSSVYSESEPRLFMRRWMGVLLETRISQNIYFRCHTLLYMYVQHACEGRLYQSACSQRSIYIFA